MVSVVWCEFGLYYIQSGTFNSVFFYILQHSVWTMRLKFRSSVSHLIGIIVCMSQLKIICVTGLFSDWTFVGLFHFVSSIGSISLIESLWALALWGKAYYRYHWAVNWNKRRIQNDCRTETAIIEMEWYLLFGLRPQTNKLDACLLYHLFYLLNQEYAPDGVLCIAHLFALQTVFYAWSCFKHNLNDADGTHTHIHPYSYIYIFRNL